MPIHSRRASCIRAGLTALASLSVAGCGGGPMVGSVAPYAPANAFLPIGYTQVPIDAEHYQVSATGTASTPRERVEKMATARAAEIGVQQRLPYFKVVSVAPGTTCRGKGRGRYRSDDTAPTIHPTVTLEVVYARTPSDPAFRASADTFQQLKAELDSEVVPPEVAAAAEAETRAQCPAG